MCLRNGAAGLMEFGAAYLRQPGLDIITVRPDFRCGKSVTKISSIFSIWKDDWPPHVTVVVFVHPHLGPEWLSFAFNNDSAKRRSEVIIDTYFLNQCPDPR